MATSPQKHMVDHLRDMFSGSFNDEIIESILIQRGWNVDRAVDDLMALTSNCTFNIPMDDCSSNNENQLTEFNEFVNNGYGAACPDSGIPSFESQNLYPVDNHNSLSFEREGGNNDDEKNESEDDVIVLEQEEYCLSGDSESEEEIATVEAATTTEASCTYAVAQPDNVVLPQLSYAAVAKPVSPAMEHVARVKPPFIMYQGYTSYDQIKRTRDSLERVKLFVKEGFRIMVLLRGCPGSGKSHLARKIVEECGVHNNIYQHVHSTDNYFCLNRMGQYLYDAEKLSEAHRWNKVNVLHVAREGLTPVIIDNTNTQIWEMEDYVKMAVCAGYEIEVMEPDTPWAFKLKELANKSQHNVSAKTIMKMLERYEHNVSALSLLKSYSLEYAPDNVPPQLGISKLSDPKLVIVFENIYNTIHVLANQTVAEVKVTAATKKKLTKAERKKRKREKKLRRMIEEVRHEDSESDEDGDLYVGDEVAQTVEAFLSNNLEDKPSAVTLKADEDAGSDNSWTTIDTHDDYDDNNLSDDEGESNSIVDEEGDLSLSYSSSQSNEEHSTTSENQSRQHNDLVKVAQKASSGSEEKAKKELNNFENADTVINDMKHTECKEPICQVKEMSKPKFSSQLYDALAKSRPRLKFFENLRADDESSSEPSKDSTFENISRKLDELDVESSQQQAVDDLELSGDLLIDSNGRNSTSTPATDDEVPHYVDENELVCVGAVNDELFTDLGECTLDSDNDADSPSNVDAVSSIDSGTSTQNQPPKCEWIGLENCVNLPHNVRIEKNVLVNDLLPCNIEKNAESVVNEANNQNLRIGDVIPLCLMNEVIESAADVTLDAQLHDNISPSTAKMWPLDWWSHDPSTNDNVLPLEQPDAPCEDDCNIFSNDVENIENNEALTSAVAITNSDIKSVEETVAVRQKVDELQYNIQQETNSSLMTAAEISDSVLMNVVNVSDVPLDKDIEEAKRELDVTNRVLSNSSTDLKNIAEVGPGSRTSLTSAIRNWLSNNLLNEVKNNTSVPFGDPFRRTSFTSAIKSFTWVSGTSYSVVESSIDVPDGGLTTNSSVSAAFENKCKQTSLPDAKNLSDDSPAKLKFECKSPIRGVKNKLCNVETEICNEADILQTMLREEMEKKRNDNGVNVDDVNVASKFETEGGGPAPANVVKNIFDGTYEDVNLFGEWNRIEKNHGEHSAIENEGESEISEAGSNSSSSDEMRTIADVHNSATRFVNNDINRDAAMERRKPNVNHEVGSRQLKNKNVGTSAATDAESECWNLDSSTPELNTLKERILINSLDKVFGQNNLELDDTPSVDVIADAKQLKKSPLSSGFQVIENKLHPETNGNDEATCKMENVTSEENDEEVSFWNQWIRGESWDETPASSVEATSDRVESKPPRKLHGSPSEAKSNFKNSDSSCWLVNDIKSCMDLEKNQQKLQKTSNFLSGGDPFLQARELREFVDDWKTPVKLQNRSPDYDLLDEQTDESKNLRRLGNEISDVSGKRKRSSEVFAGTAFSSKWGLPCDGESKSFNFTDSIAALRTSPVEKQQQQESPVMFALGDKTVGKDNKVDGEASRWKFNSQVGYDANFSNCWPKTISTKAVPVSEKDILMDECKFEHKQKPLELDNLFIPPEVLNLSQNKATNTGASDVNGYDRHLVTHCREINGRDGSSSELLSIEPRYNNDKSTMTEGEAYTVKAKPQREDLSNMFPHEMVDTILDLYEKCNGNMDWIIEILMEDGYSPSDDQLEYLSSLQNVVEYRKSAATSPIKEKLSFEKKKRGLRNRSRKNESTQNIVLRNKHLVNQLSKSNVSIDNNVPNEFSSTSEQAVDDAMENGQENLLGTTVYEDTFDDSTECVDLFIDWTTVSQLIKYFGNPTVYPIQDYQPVIKIPVSLARHLHAHLIESVIDQAEKNENLMNQLNFEMNAGLASGASSHELTQKDVTDVEGSFPDYLVVDERIDIRVDDENGDFFCTNEAEPVRSEDSFAAKFSLNLLQKAFPTIDSSFVKDTFRSQNFNYFKTKSILSQYKDEVPVVNLKEVPPVGATEVKLDENNFSDNDIRLFDSSVIKSSSREEILAQVCQFREDAAVNFSQWKRCHEKLKSALRDKNFNVASHCRETMQEFKQKYERCNAQAASLLVTSCCFQNDNIIDLHFFKVIEALQALDIFLDHHIKKLVSSGRQKAVLYIITGRGSRSMDGVSHLQPPIKQRLKQRDIEFCIESTNTGLVKAVIRKTSLLSQDM